MRLIAHFLSLIIATILQDNDARAAEKSSMTSPNHIPILDHLRGLAALSVCLYHFTNVNFDFLAPEDPMRQIGSYGWLGVESFFVISGFVIPYSLYLRSYGFENIRDFLVRRLKRLEPPYLLSIALAISLIFISSILSGPRTESQNLGWLQLLCHFFYLNAIFDLGWLNPVFWTLAIEFQFYLFIAISFPLLFHKSLHVRILSVVIISVLGFAGNGNSALLPHWLPVFAIGLTSALYFAGKLPGWLFIIQSIGVSSISLALVGFAPTVVGIATAFCVLFFGFSKPSSILSPLAFLGTISYSLYLVHFPIGCRIINLGERITESITIRYATLFSAILISIGLGWIFWWIVERPSQRWSKTTKRQTDFQSNTGVFSEASGKA